MQVRAQSVVIGTTFTKKENMDEQEKIPHNIEVTLVEQYNEELDKYMPVTELYEDIVGYQVGNGVIAVLTKEGETHIFPTNLVTFVRHFPKNA